MEQRRNFYRVLSDPFGGLKSHKSIVWELANSGNRPGPYVAGHLPSIGVGLTSLGSGFPPGEPNKVVYDYDPKMPLRDLEAAATYWIISEAARGVLESFAASAIDLAPVDVSIRRNGQDEPAGPHWLCDVIRFEDAIDESASTLNWYVKQPQYDMTGSKFVFKAGLPSDLHLFRLWKAPAEIVCSQELRDAIVAAHLTGVILTKL